METTLKAFARDNYEFTDQELKGVDDPRILRLFAELHAHKTALAKVKPKAPPPVQPLPTTKVRSAAPADAKPRDSDSPDAWYAKREAMLAKRRAMRP